MFSRRNERRENEPAFQQGTITIRSEPVDGGSATGPTEAKPAVIPPPVQPTEYAPGENTVEDTICGGAKGLSADQIRELRERERGSE